MELALIHKIELLLEEHDALKALNPFAAMLYVCVLASAVAVFLR